MSSVGWGERQAGAVTRRDFLRVGGLGFVGLSLVDPSLLADQTEAMRRRGCIFVLMTGGPSQLDTFDPKPSAPSYIRGPLRAISTRVPGVWLNESLPLLADRADRFALIRSLSHDAAPIHETGQQLLQTGRLGNGEIRFPNFGSVAARLLGSRGSAPAYTILPQLVSGTGVNTWRGQQAGFLGAEFEPAIVAPDAAQLAQEEPESIRRAYGDTRFGRLLLEARRQVEMGTRCVTVNLFDSLRDQPTWDCHGNRASGLATLIDYRDQLCPQFDRAMAALLDDLSARGLLEDTLVVATGEFGRTPKVNEYGGRDHWPGVWSAMIAGAGVRGGAVIGASDAIASAPIDRPIAPGELTATMYHALGLDPQLTLATFAGQAVPLSDHQPIRDLFA